MPQEILSIFLGSIVILLGVCAAGFLVLGIKVLRILAEQAAEANRTFSGIEARLKTIEEALLSLRRALLQVTEFKDRDRSL